MTLDDLNDIEGKYGTDFLRCLDQMLQGWLKRTSLQPTLKSLCSALKGDLVQEEGLADEVYRMWISKVGQLGA